jgi:endonuclease/exonuclease/phosphatase family metal-dependent hydrolase
LLWITFRALPDPSDMKRKFLPIVLIAVFVAANTAGARTVRVATFNIENGPDAPDSPDYNATRDTVRRINADIVAFQEIVRDKTNNWQQMAAELGYTNVHLGTTNSAGGLLGFFSRFPVQQVTNLSSVAPANEFTRRPMRVVVQVPGAVRPLVLWNMHHKADDFTPTNTPANQFRRAIEAHRIVQDINAYRSNNPTHTELVMLGDLNENIFGTTSETLGQTNTAHQLVQFSQSEYTALRSNSVVFADSYQLGADITFPVPYRTFPDTRYGAAGLQRLDLRQQNGTWTGTRGGKQLGSGRYTALDYILISTNLTNGAKGEIFNAEWEPAGLPKAGAPLATNTSTNASDHFAVFADIQMQDAPTGLIVSPTNTVQFSGLVGGPFTSATPTYAVSNPGVQAVSFTVSSNAAWLVPQITSGTVAAGATNSFSISVNAAAAPTAPGDYTGSITVTGAPGTPAVQRSVLLKVLSPVTDYLTQQFSNLTPFNLANRSVTFTPDGSVNFYRATIATVSAFPVDPTGGTPLPATSVYSFEVSLADGKSLPLFGTNYNRFFIGSAGYITFLGPDTQVAPSPANHFAAPRISGLFFDLDPRTGTVSYKQTADRVAVTYQNIPQFRQGGSNNFQIEMFFDGRIRLTWLGVGASAPGGGVQPPLVGLSPGGGLPAQFTPSAFTNYPPTPAESAYDAFVRSYGLDPSGSGARAQDPDMDGYPNWSEFSFGGSPVAGDPALVQVQSSGNQMVFTLLCRGQGVGYSVEQTSDLNVAFTTAGSIILSNAPDQSGVATGWLRKQFSVPASPPGFYRVRAVDLGQN